MSRNLLIRGGADFSGMRREMQSTSQSLNKFQNNVSSAMKKVGYILGGLAIGKIIKDSTTMAMGVESSINQIGRTMGTHAQEFQSWVQSQAKGYGMATSEAYKYGATFSNLVSGFSKDTAETTKRTEDLLKASAVVASGTGRTMEDTMERIRSGLLGNTESIEDLGINVNVAMLQSTEAFKKFANGKTWQQLDFQTQQQIRLMAILEQANTKYGDTLANTTATKQQMFIASLKNAQLALGQAFLPIYNVILPALTSMVNALTSVLNVIAQFSQALFGNTNSGQKQAQDTQKQANAMTNLGDATEKAGKQAKNSVAGFDEIHNLVDDKDSGTEGSDNEGVGGQPTVAPSLDVNTSGINPKIQEFADNIKTKVKEITDTIVSNKEIIISALGGILAGFVAFETLTFLSTLPTVFTALGTAITALLSPIALASIAIGALVASFLYLYQTNEDFRNRINQVWVEISSIMNSFVNDTLRPIFDYIVNEFLVPLGQAFMDNILPILADVFVGAGQIFGDLVVLLQSTVNNIWGVLRPALDLTRNIVIDFLEIIKKLWDKYGQDLINYIREFIQGVQETFQFIWDNILNPIIKPALEMLTWLWNEHLKGLVQQIGEFVMKCANGALELYNKFFKPIIDWMVVNFGPAISNTVAFVVDVFGTMLAGISDVIKSIFKVLGGIVDFVTGVFTGNWSKAWQGVKDIFGGIFDSLVGLVKVPLNYIIDAINFVIRGLSKLSIDIPSWVPSIGGQKWGINIPEIPKLATGGITDVNNPFMAIVGDNKTQREVVAPLDDLMGMITGAVGTGMMGAMQFNTSNNNSPTGDIILQVDGTTFARVIGPYTNQESQRIGNNLIIQTV